MVSFRIMPQHTEELKSEGAGWIAGHFEVGEIDCTICLFKDRHCMLMLTLKELLDYLLVIDRYEGKRIGWMGMDNGKSIALKKQKGIFSIEGEYFNAQFHFKDFRTAVLNESNRFVNHCKIVNPLIEMEGAFIDLNYILSKFG